MVLDVLDVLDASVLVLVLVQSSFRIPSHGWKRHRRQPVRLGQAAARAWVTRETSSGDGREAMAARMATQRARLGLRVVAGVGRVVWREEGGWMGVAGPRPLLAMMLGFWGM